VEGINIASVTIMAIATVFLAIFTWRTWKISAEQHKLYHDPDLTIYPLIQPEAGEKSFSSKLLNETSNIHINYSVILVNPGRVPIVITHIKERLLLSDGKESEITMNFESPPSDGSSRAYMVTIPSVIGGGDFSICRRFFNIGKLNIPNAIKPLITEFMYIEIHYTVGKRMKYERQQVLLHLRMPAQVSSVKRKETTY
jgi:hypothetical protein